MTSPPLCQIAFSVTDLNRTRGWYREAFGFLPAGGTHLFRGPLTARVQGLPRAASTCRWLVDSQDFFQLEMFQFSSPRARPMPPDRRLCDTGYGMVGLHVADLDATLARLGRLGTAPITRSVGNPGARRVCVRDPEGVLLELMEDDPRRPGAAARPRPEVPVTARFVTATVPDLARSRRFFVDVLGLEPAQGVELHGSEHEALWELEGARRDALVLWAGDLLVELVQYADPPGRPWPDGYRISDQGLLNVALGFRSRADFDRVHGRALAAGHRGNWRPLNIGAFTVVYLNDDQGFSVELLHAARWADGLVGFRPRRR